MVDINCKKNSLLDDNKFYSSHNKQVIHCVMRSQIYDRYVLLLEYLGYIAMSINRINKIHMHCLIYVSKYQCIIQDASIFSTLMQTNLICEIWYVCLIYGSFYINKFLQFPTRIKSHPGLNYETRNKSIKVDIAKVAPTRKRH